MGLVKKMSLQDKIGDFEFFQLRAKTMFVIDLKDFTFNKKSFSEIDNSKNSEKKIESKRKLNFFHEDSYKKQISTVLDLNEIHLSSDASKDQEMLNLSYRKDQKDKKMYKMYLTRNISFHRV